MTPIWYLRFTESRWHGFCVGRIRLREGYEFRRQQSKRRSMKPSNQILVVERDCAVREALVGALALESYRVVSAATIHQALQVLSSTQISLVILDLSPTNETGWSVSRWLGESKPDVPVIAIASQTYDTTPTLPAGVDVWFEKPFDIVSLIQTSQRLLAKSEESQHGRIAATTRALKNSPGKKEVTSDTPEVKEVLHSI